jgi:hypothetical protein
MPSLLDLINGQQPDPGPPGQRPRTGLLGRLENPQYYTRGETPSLMYMPQEQNKAGKFPVGQPLPGWRGVENLLSSMIRRTANEQDLLTTESRKGNIENLTRHINPQSWEDLLARAPISTNVDNRTLIDRPIPPNYQAPPEMSWEEILAKDPRIIDKMSMAAGYGDINPAAVAAQERILRVPQDSVPLPRPRPKKSSKDD